MRRRSRNLSRRSVAASPCATPRTTSGTDASTSSRSHGLTWAYMGRQVRVRLVELLDEALPGWSGRYTFQPLLSMSNADYEWIQSTAVAIFEDEVAIEEAAGDPGGLTGPASA